MVFLGPVFPMSASRARHLLSVPLPPRVRRLSIHLAHPMSKVSRLRSVVGISARNTKYSVTRSACQPFSGGKSDPFRLETRQIDPRRGHGKTARREPLNHARPRGKIRGERPRNVIT